MKMELAKEFYLDEWARRDQLTGSIGTPIAVMSAAAGALALMIGRFSSVGALHTTIFAGLAAVAIIALLVGSYFVARSYHGYGYERVAHAAELDEYCKKLHAYHQAVGSPDGAADREFDEWLADRFVGAGDLNAENNDSKSAYLYRASQSILTALAFTALASIPWALSAVKSKPQAEKVQLVSPVDVVLKQGQPNVTRDSAPSPRSGAPGPAAITPAAPRTTRGSTKPPR